MRASKPFPKNKKFHCWENNLFPFIQKKTLFLITIISSAITPMPSLLRVLTKHINPFALKFIIPETQVNNPKKLPTHTLPFPFDTAAELLAHCEREQCSIAELMWKNELTWRNEDEIHQQLNNIMEVMEECIHQGFISTDAILPGGLKVRRRAPGLYRQLQHKHETKLEGTLL